MTINNFNYVRLNNIDTNLLNSWLNTKFTTYVTPSLNHSNISKLHSTTHFDVLVSCKYKTVAKAFLLAESNVYS